MKNKILEVQNYFINKITACDFNLKKLDIKSNGWNDFDVEIDGFEFRFSVLNTTYKVFCSFSGFIKVEVPNDRLSNLLELIESKMEDAKLEKIEKLKAELEQLTN